jgi:formiminoglutamase
MSFYSLTDFLEPVHLAMVSGDAEIREGQIGKTLMIYEDEMPDLSQADVVIASCNDLRGDGDLFKEGAGTDKIRKEFYALYQWHKDIKIADIGNIRSGASVADTYAAVKAVATECLNLGKRFLLLGGSHDLTLALYEVYQSKGKIIEATGVDAYIDLSIDNPVRSRNFLMEMLTGDPNFIKHYNHIGFQSYYVHPTMLETMDQLRFDCFRLGKVKENIEEMEPAFRSSDLLSFDLSALGSPTFWEGSSPNGFNGEEACTLMKYAGMSDKMMTLGIFGYNSKNDSTSNLAKQVSQMLWYYIDGIHTGRTESSLNEKESFIECHIAFGAVETTFIQSIRTGRWWMKMPDNNYVPCSQNDFNQAGNNELPERWLRLQERN